MLQGIVLGLEDRDTSENDQRGNKMKKEVDIRATVSYFNRKPFQWIGEMAK